MDLNSALSRCPVIAILRGITTGEVGPVFEALESAGISIAEIPLNSPDPFASIALAVKTFGARMLVGAGTVLELNQVEKVAAAGAKLIVMPHSDAAIVQEAKRLGMIAVPGFSTATEAFAMLSAGADAIKLFPAEVGGVAFLKALCAVLPKNTKVIPVGGVDRQSMAAWKQAGAAGFGIGSALYKPGDAVNEVKSKALAFVNLGRELV
jgi:2-dehydro-3-deoxyphosphogalactonate aldolase